MKYNRRGGVYEDFLTGPGCNTRGSVMFPSDTARFGAGRRHFADANFLSERVPCVWTYHNDNTRGGVNPNETVFTPAANFANLTPTTFSTDGLIYAQPLYIHGLDDSFATGSACDPVNYPSCAGQLTILH